MQTTPHDPWVGKTVGEGSRYRLEKVLGRGGMGKVYKALDLQVSTATQPVYRAIKFLAINMVNNLSVKLRFQREMQACVLIRDPRIVQTLDFGVIPMMIGGQRQEVPMLVMEMVEGKTLEDVLYTKSRLDLRRAVHLGREMALALETVHQGVILEGKEIHFVHRDLKPPNVFVVPDGRGGETIKLGDFGLVKYLGDTDEKSITRTGAYAGTPEYSSPEQIHQFKSVDGRADLYSLGCLLYRMIRGGNAFGLSAQASLIEWFTAHTGREPAPLPANLGVPAELEQLMRRCLAKDPEERFPSAADLASALAEIEAKLPTGPNAAIKALEASLNRIVSEQLTDQPLRIQMQCKGEHLGIMFTRPSADPVDYAQLTQIVSTQVASLLPETGITQVKVFSRPPGQNTPDWQQSVQIPRETRPSQVADSASPASPPIAPDPEPPPDPGPTLDLTGYCLVRNQLMLTTSLPDPAAPVAQLVRVFHELHPDQKQQLLPSLVTWFLDNRPASRTQLNQTRTSLPEPLQKWFQSLEEMNDREQRSVAIWLSRYCADPEKVLPLLTASLLAAKESETESPQRKTYTPQPIFSYYHDRVVYEAKRHWILFLDSLGSAALQFVVAAFVLSVFTPEAMQEFFSRFLNPFVMIASLFVLLFIARIAINLLKLINFIPLILARPFTIGGTILVALVGLLYSFGVPQMWVVSLLLVLILANVGVQTWIAWMRWRHSPLSLTEMARIAVKPGSLTQQDLRDPELDIYRSDQIQAIEIHHSSLGKTLNFGRVDLVLSDQPMQSFKNIANPFQLKTFYNRQVSKLRQLQENIEISQQLQSDDPWIHQSIGERERYRLDSLIGQGGMGKVYKGFDQQLFLPVAVKFMLGELGSSQDRLERFQAEMRASVYLTDDRVVRVLNSGLVQDPESAESEGGSLPYMVMEFVDAPTLAQAMNEQVRWSVERAVHIATEIAEALHAIHTGVIFQGQPISFVHRDLKPGNIFLIKRSDGSETIKVADFGLVKIQGTMQSLSESKAGRFIGTARYASPEQCMGSETIDGRSDLYSLGCILYELLTGQNPFGLPAQASATQYLMAHVQRAVAPFPDRLKIPPDLSEILNRCLHKEPDQRYSTAAELSEALHRFLQTYTSKAP